MKTIFRAILAVTLILGWPFLGIAIGNALTEGRGGAFMFTTLGAMLVLFALGLWIIHLSNR